MRRSPKVLGKEARSRNEMVRREEPPQGSTNSSGIYIWTSGFFEVLARSSCLAVQEDLTFLVEHAGVEVSGMQLDTGVVRDASQSKISSRLPSGKGAGLPQSLPCGSAGEGASNQDPAARVASLRLAGTSASRACYGPLALALPVHVSTSSSI